MKRPKLPTVRFIKIADKFSAQSIVKQHSYSVSKSAIFIKIIVKTKNKIYTILMHSNSSKLCVFAVVMELHYYTYKYSRYRCTFYSFNSTINVFRIPNQNGMLDI